MKRREKLTPVSSPVEETAPSPITLGGFVRYYYEGWRTGMLEELTDKTARIRPIGANKRLITINRSDIEPYEKK